MLTQRDLNKLTDAIVTAFSKLGRNGQSLKSTNNQDSFVWDMHTAKLLETLAKKRREEALKFAIAAGIAPDTDREPQDIGERVLFTGDNMVLSLKVQERSAGVDYKVFTDLLLKKGMKPADIAECLHAAEKPKSKQHIFSATPIVE